MAALEAGRYPSRSEVAAWTYAESSVQLAFPELVTASATKRATGRRSVDDLLRAVRLHDDAVRKVLVLLQSLPDPDVDRAEAIRDVRGRHPGERIIAFAEAAETVEVLFQLLRKDGGVAMVRARGGAVSGGALSRREVIARFAPLAQGAKEPHRSQRIDLLLATDLLSEGVNLQDASVVIHVDLPWNPARLEQRVGRVSRLGSRHQRVSVYAIRPPAASERLLAVERRLRAKLAAAGRALGVVGTILPGFNSADPNERGVAEEWTRVHTLLRGWQAAGGDARTGGRGGAAGGAGAEAVHVAATRSSVVGFLAMLMENRRPILLASTDRSDPSASPRPVAAAIELASAADVPVDRRALAEATRSIDAWMARRAAAELSGIDVAAVARARRRVLARIARIAARAPRHARSVVSLLAADARRAALVPLGEGGERVLAELADAPLADQAWLRAIVAFGDAHARSVDRAAPHDPGGPPGLRALLLLSGP
jgi:hypothetical protein